MEGPRAIKRTELDSLRALTGTVFRPTLMDEYPHLFNEDNLENLRVCVEEGRCVSHVGMKQQGASLFGCRIQTACIGAVGTDPAYRQRGLASACFDDAVEKATRDGVDIMLVSGDRNLYRRRGCMIVGADYLFQWTSAPSVAEGGRCPERLTVTPMTQEDLPRVMACYRREPVRFLRTPDDYRYALQSGMVMNRRSRFWVIREENALTGYVVLHAAGEERRAAVGEFAGDRRAILWALAELLTAQKLASIRWQVLRYDEPFLFLCTQAKLEGAPAATPGTLKLINFPQLMQRLQPYWEEIIGPQEAASLSFRQQGEEVRFGLGERELVTDRDTATRLLFGTISGEERQAMDGYGRLMEVLQQMLPLPCLWYGLNYV